MLKGLILIAMVAIIATLAAVACGGGDDGEATAPPPPAAAGTPPPAAAAPPPQAPPPPATPSADCPAGATQVTVINHDLGGPKGAYGFEPKELTFKLGETVCFTNIAETELHSFTVDELGIDIDINGSGNPGATGTVTHTFDKAGTFRLVCIYHEGNGMVGTLTVQ